MLNLAVAEILAQLDSQQSSYLAMRQQKYLPVLDQVRATEQS
jgi:hypothetical protein